MNSETRIIIGFVYLCLGVALSVSTLSTNSRKVRLPHPKNTDRCRLPQHPTFGKWTIYGGTTRQSPGKLVPLGTILELKCQHHYKLDGEEISTCFRGRWKPKISQCLRTCPTLKDTPFMTINCTFNGKTVKNCSGSLEGTLARFSCADFYEDQALEIRPHSVCSAAGSWGRIPECVPVCGKKYYDPRLIVRGTKAKQGEYPWQIALYTIDDKILICGGSLLNERVVLTAAHCVTDMYGFLLPEDIFMVVAGKYYRKYDHHMDFNKAQFSPISQMYIPRQYKGDLQNYFGDIAILVCAKPFVLSRTVQPVCVDWALTRFLNYTTSQHGFVTGWGFTVEYKKPSKVLKVLEVPMIDETECNQRLPSENKRLMTDDKLCAGFLNSNASVCKGDSGGGLVYEFGGRYFLFAVVSVSPPAQTQESGCDSQHYTLYTNVSYYTEKFILDKETRFRPSDFGDIMCNYDPRCKPPIPKLIIEELIVPPPDKKDYCLVRNHPEFGKWSNNSLLPGQFVSPGTKLILQCDESYKLVGTNVSICLNRTWSSEIGECLKICSPRVSTATMKVTCIDENTETENCTDAADGTLAKYQCAPYYEDIGLKRRPTHVCQNGTWNQATPNCTPICGRSNTEDPGNYPWQVDVHSASNIEFLCFGSLLSQKIVLTVSSRITDSKGTFLPKENITVAAGKSSRDNNPQYFHLQDIIFPEKHHSDVLNYVPDMAILVIEKLFQLSDNLQPVCINFARIFETPKHADGQITMRFSNNLKEELLNVSIFSASECNKKLKSLELLFVDSVTVTDDKFCVFIPHNGVLMNERGRGMYQKTGDRFYIVGILTSFYVSKAYTPLNVMIYTTVSKHFNKFIIPQLAKYRS